MSNWFHTRQISTLILLAITLICASCNSYKQAALYPMIHSVDQKKSVFRTNLNHKFAYQKSLPKDSIKIDLSSKSSLKTIKIGYDSIITRLESISLVRNLSTTNNRNRFPTHLNNQGTLTASMSSEPYIARYNFIPDTSKIHDSTLIDSTQINITQVHPTNEYDYFDSNAKKQKNRETFANISLIAAIASIATLFIVPVLFLPAVIAAIVFGALGLKSSKKKKARTGMLIGIIMVVLFTLFVLAYAGVFS
jgi:hypothetical protein